MDRNGTQAVLHQFYFQTFFFLHSEMIRIWSKQLTEVNGCSCAANQSKLLGTELVAFRGSDGKAHVLWKLIPAWIVDLFLVHEQQIINPNPQKAI